MKFYGDLETWLLDEGDRIYRYLVYKKFATPCHEKNADDSVYESTYYTLCKIEEAIDLGNDWLLGLRSIGDDGEIFETIQYYKFSDIHMELFEADQQLALFKERKRKD